MARNWFKLILICCAALFIPSCGTGQRLTAIQVTPATVTFGAADPLLNAQLTAIGTYTHPPATKDLTSQVNWTASVPQVAKVTSAGMVSPNTNCGISGVTATFKTNDPSNNIITGTMTVTVDGPTNVGCPGNTLPTITVLFAGTGTGVVTSAPPGINCTASCALAFPVNTQLTLTATPTGTSVFAGWADCDSTTGQSCLVALGSARTVTVTFN